jgi:hypothetical protein
MISPLSQIKRYAEGDSVEAPIATDQIPTEVVPSISDKAQGDLNQGQILLNAQIERLKSSLDKRMNPPFDPMWMKMAAGFLKPSQTGSFGESLGNAAEGAASQAEKDIARHSDIEKMKLELAQKQYELSNQAEAEKMFKSHLSGQQKVSAPTVDKNLTSKALGTTSVPAEHAANAVLENPNVMDQITWDPESVALIALKNPTLGKVAGEILKSQQEKVKLLLDQQKVEQGRYASTPGGVFEPSTGQYRERNPQVVERTLPVIGPVKITFDQSNTFDKLVSDARLTGDNTKVKQFLSELQGSLPTKVTTETTLKTPQEKEVETSGAKKSAEERATLSVKDEQGLRLSHQQSPSIINSANNLISLATSNPRIFNLMQGTDLGDAINRTVTNGISTPGGSISIDMHDIVAAVSKLPPADRSAAMMAAQDQAMLQLSFAKTFLKGEGSVSDNERKLAAQASIGNLDNATATRLKAEAIKLHSEQDSKIYKAYTAFRKENKDSNLDDFYTSDKYDKLVNDYESRLDRVRQANAKLLSGSNIHVGVPEVKRSSSKMNALDEEIAKRKEKGKQ